jgi:hypothetical protein
MSTAELNTERTTEQVIEVIYRFAAQQMERGISASRIKQNLTDQGLDDETAATVVNNLRKVRAQILRQAGPMNMLQGALWCVGGTCISIVSFELASGPQGGTYVVAWGAVVFGGLQFFRGMFQLIRGLF